MDGERRTACEISSYLLPLLEARPSGEAKLLAAWNGLCIEHQVLLLDNLGKNGHLDWTTKIRAKVLTSPNAYVRYLAARGFRPGEDDAEEVALKKHIDADPEPLVRYAPLEDDDLFPLRPEFSDGTAFFALPHDARLALVRSLPHKGEAIASLIRYAAQSELPSERVTEDELADILLDYVTNPEFKSYYDPENEELDGYAEYSRGKDIEQLWMLVPDVPVRVAVPLARSLPERSGMSQGIPERVLDSLRDEQHVCLLQLLLQRPDIGLGELRGKIFREYLSSRQETDPLRNRVFACAISHNFSPTYEEFAQILASPEEVRLGIMVDLARYASAVSLCIFQAAHDVLRETEWSKAADPYHDVWEEAIRQQDRFERKLIQLRDEEYSGREQLYAWALYKWAKRAVPWKTGQEGYYVPCDDLAFLSKCVKAGDTWGTFMAFSGAWKAEVRKNDACRKATEQAIWEMVDAGLYDERKRVLQDLGISEAGEDA